MTSTIKVDTISENTSANGVAVDGVTLKDGGIAATDGCTITTADNTETLVLTSTDADAAVGPILVLRRDSSSPADDDLLGNIQMEMENSNGSKVDVISVVGQAKDITAGTEDAFLQFNVITAGSLVDVFHISPTETVFNDASVDRNFRIESNGNATMLVVDGENNRVGIGSNPDLGVGLHIKSADSGAGANADADELVVEGSGHSGISILSATGDSGRICFGDSGDNDRGQIIYQHGSNHLSFSADAEDACLTVHNAQNVSMGVTEDAPDVSAGLCINQGGNDGTLMSFKSSDVAHGITGSAETDTYLSMGKASGTQGGLVLKSYAEGDDGFLAESFCGTINTTKGTGGNACFMFKGRAADNGSGFQNPTSTAANANLFAIANGNLRVFIFDGEGDLHADGALNATAYDTYEDAHLVRAMDLSHGQNLKGLVNSKFDEYINYNHETLAEAGLVGREEDGTPNHFINVTGMQRLHNGAIWQQYEKTQRLTNAMYELAKAAVGEEKANEILEQNEIKLLN